MPVRMTTGGSFEAPYNWCDRQCERCSLPNTCHVALRDARRRWRRAECDTLKDFHFDLRRSEILLQQISEREGIDLSAPLPPPPTRLEAERLRRAGLWLLRCLSELADSPDHARATECVQLCIQVMSKAARVMSYLEARFADAWASDAVPNLLLIELCLNKLRQTLLELNTPQTVAALARLEQLIAPLLAAIDDAARIQLSELVRLGHAPSPFLLVSPKRQQS